MDFNNNFRLGLILRVLTLFAAMFITVFSYYQNEWYVTTVVSGILTIFILIIIIRYAEKYKRGLGDFLLSVKSRDFISSSNIIADKNSKGLLREAYQIIVNEFQNIRIEKEVHYHYLKTIIEHIKVALLSFNEAGEIQFINQAAKQLLNLKNFSRLKDIQSTDMGLFQLMQTIKSGNSELIKLKRGQELMHLSVYATEIKLLKEKVKVISLQDIKQELEFHELESWQKLIRVLTHEIMNSVTPISSLSTAINEFFDDIKNRDGGLAKLSHEDLEDVLSSLKTIEKRSNGLLRFVSTYKQLTRIPRPDFKEVNLIELVTHCCTLLKQNFNEHEITFTIDYSKQKHIHASVDYDQIEQVIINLLINAIEAVKEKQQPKINIIIIPGKNNHPQIVIRDNGKGIDAETLDKIFIPFYTSKKEGSGIGLSLSRQIMRMHKGSIHVNSEPGIGSQFTLAF
ncbi:MAG: HAMP domain-containing sensor histidine kinase [Bacteroidales bacterium]|jgi:nitrogen fixation/metabolism regulation signal transduction histidine kinase|nr:HAMP domain-containing sensor histidine kinase [Bacteroidales bacterium]